MFKKTMKFDDLDGNEVEQTFYFNYNKKEVAELLEFGYTSQFPPADGKRREGLESQLAKLTTPVEDSGLSQQENNQQAYDVFQDLILNAYGRKGEDNVTFVKNASTRDYFQSHVAFVEMVFEFLEDTKLAGEFIENCLPAKLVAIAKKEMEKQSAAEDVPYEQSVKRNVFELPAVDDGGGVPATAPEDLTPQDIADMEDVTFNKLDTQKLSKDALLAAFRRKSQS